MTYISKETMAMRLALAERDEESSPLGGTVRLRELTRAQLRDASAWSASTSLADREQLRGAQLALAVGEAGGDAGRLRQALTTYYLGAPERATDADRWNVAIFAAGAVDPETHQPLFARDDVLTWPDRGDIWREIARLAQAILDLSEVGQAALKSGDPAPAAE